MSEKITAEEAARILGYHRDHVYRLLRQGILPGEHFNRSWMIDRKDVEDLKAQQGERGRLPR